MFIGRNTAPSVASVDLGKFSAEENYIRLFLPFLNAKRFAIDEQIEFAWPTGSD